MSRKHHVKKPTGSKPGRTMTGDERMDRQAHLADCKKASRSVTLRQSAIPIAWQGQAMKSKPVPKLTGKLFTVEQYSKPVIGPGKPGHFAIEASRATETPASNFDRIIHLRGITAKTFKLMTGEETQPVKLYNGIELDRKLGKIRASSPCEASESFDPRFADKVLLRTRKGRKLAQRVVSGKTVVIPSAGQLSRAGIDYDYRIAGEESETIKLDKPVEESMFEHSRILASMSDSELALNYLRGITIQAAITRASQVSKGKPGKPLNIGPRIDRAFLNALAYRRLIRNARFTSLFGPAF